MTPVDELVRRSVRAILGAEVERSESIDDALGLRRFFRVWLAAAGDRELPASLIARVEAPEDPAGRPTGVPPEPPLEPIRAFLQHHGLPVPARYGGDRDAGVELLEDLGSESLKTRVESANAGERDALYSEACHLVPRLQALDAPEGGLEAFSRRLDAPLFAYKADLFARFSLGTGSREPSAAQVQVVKDAFARIADEAARAPARLAHRDLQSTNLRVVSRPRGPRLFLIDLQGALLAPAEYDLVCLLRDSYVELPETEVKRHRERVRPLLPDAPDPETFAHRFDLLTLSRKGKDHARFVYAARERGDERFLRYLPATVRALKTAAHRAARRDPAFANLAEIVAELPETPCAR